MKSKTLSMRKLSVAALAAALTVITGCDWESSGDGDFWSERYAYLDFSGIYTPETGKASIVHTFEGGQAVLDDERRVAAQQVGAGDGSSRTYNGVLEQRPLVPGSLSIVAGGYQLVDDGDNTLVGNLDSSGHINYQTGAWFVDFGAALGAGTPINASWQYVERQQVGPVPTATAQPIYQFTVHQTGNNIRLIDNYGQIYEGVLEAVDTLHEGEPVDDQRDIDKSISFVAEGVFHGEEVRIVGNFRAYMTVYYSRVVEYDDWMWRSYEGLEELYRSASYFMEGTWIEASGRTGRISAIGPAERRIQIVE